jgi:hypothetical protein
MGHLEGNTDGSDIGYYFPVGSQSISVRKARNAGDWSLVGTSSWKSGRELFRNVV